jgi:oligoendopeptidase F
MRRLELLVFALAAVTLSAPAPASAQGDDDWDLTGLFLDVASWDAARLQVLADTETFSDCAPRLTKSPSHLLECLDRYFALQKAADRVWTYASSGASTDNRDAEANARRGDAGPMWTALSEATAFVEPALVAAGAKTLGKHLKKEPGLASYAHFIEHTLRGAEHTLDADGEALLASASPVLRAPYRVFNMLTTADMDWPEITLTDGTVITLDKPAYGHWRGAPDRADRQIVFDAFYTAIGGVQRTLGANLNTHLAADNFSAKARGYGSTLEAALFGDGIPTSVYRTLVEQANANLPTLHRYFTLRGQMLDIEDLSYIDIYPSLVDLDQSFPLSRGKELSLASFASLGEDYVATVKTGFEDRWMDAYPKDGKAGGAYATGVYDVHPYVFMNYQDDYQSVTTLAHEWGHAMHTSLATAAQPYPTANYDTFMAEVASTFNEALLLDHVLDEAKSDEERLYFLGSALEGLRGTFFRQAMFAEFELAIHERVEAGEALTGERLSVMYLELLRRFHGHDIGVMQIDDAFAAEWAWIPHFYYGYYVFQYATSIAASSLLAERVLTDQEGAVQAYLDLLRAGGSAYSYELLKAAGVDLATPAPYEALVARMNAIMDEMEALIAKQPPVENPATE